LAFFYVAKTLLFSPILFFSEVPLPPWWSQKRAVRPLWLPKCLQRYLQHHPTAPSTSPELLLKPTATGNCPCTLREMQSRAIHDKFLTPISSAFGGMSVGYASYLFTYFCGMATLHFAQGTRAITAVTFFFAFVTPCQSPPCCRDESETRSA
jgi:hypothetical protein